MDIDEDYDAQMFWERYGDLIKKDLPVILRTQVKQSTLSTWRSKKKFPRADMAVKIAKALDTTVEYLVTGEEKEHPVCTPWAMAVALKVDQLNDAGKKIVFDVAKGLETQYPLEDSPSTLAAN
ncbi:MAG: helix-turn-helix domain containing protein [Treponema sp.]|jgi:transcriptional regulator with XRE-family HTH domain|nr:helix-turn-helix domain containing protein [Treponema sp.]